MKNLSINARTANDAFLKVLKALREDGETCSPRGLKITELLNVSISIEHPKNRLITFPERAISLPFAFGEFLWYLRGAQDLETMSYYSSLMKKFSDDGKTLNSAYGYRIFGRHKSINFNQWDEVVSKLRQDPDSRQAIIHLHTPNNQPTKDEVCTLSLQFLIRNGKLNMITTMRSNDIYYGFTYDVFSFTCMMEMIAYELDIEMGTYYHNVGSMHIYEDKMHMLSDDFLMDPLNEYVIKHTPDLNLDGLSRGTTELQTFFAFERLTRQNECFLSYAPNNNFLKIAKKVLLQYSITKHYEKSSFTGNHRAFIDSLYYDNIYDWMMFNFYFRKEERSLFIAEGADGSGKTTLCQKIECDKIFHFKSPSKDFNPLIYIQSLKSSGSKVLDRSFISEMIYSEFFRRSSIIEPSFELALLDCLEKHPSVKVVILMNNRHYLDEQDLVKIGKNNISRLNALYRSFANMVLIPICIPTRIKE